MSALSDLPGVVLADDGLPLHFGNPLTEQRTLHAGARVLVPRDVIQLTGPDRLTWLDSISSQSLSALKPGAATETLILSPEGRVEHALRLVDDGEKLTAIVAAGTGDALVAWLKRMRFWNQVEIESVDARVMAWTGDAIVAGITWADPWPNVLDGGVRYAADAAPWDWHETVVAADAVPDEPRVGTIAADALRVAAGRPTFQEVDATTIPHELDWLTTAVHLSKGCYRGQETVAKVHNLGSPPRRLTLLHLDGSESQLPVAGDTVLVGDKEAGRVTAAALHFELGPIALAVLKRSVATDVDLVVATGEPETLVAASQEVIVPPTAGQAHRPPRLPRLGAVKRPPTASPSRDERIR